jgi:hypothetical protein
LSQITNDSSALSRRKHKRSQSGENEDENQKKKKYNVVLIHDIQDVEIFINRMMERLDNLEDENSHLSGLSNIVTKELKEVKKSYIKLNSKHTNLVKIVEVLKKEKMQLVLA